MARAREGEGSRAKKKCEKCQRFLCAMSGGFTALSQWLHKVKAPCCSSGVEKKHWSSELNPFENTSSPSSPDQLAYVAQVWFSSLPSVQFVLTTYKFAY